MTELEEIKAEIETLPPEDFAHLREWFAEKDEEIWDKQIEADASAGKLDFLLQEAMEAKSQGKLKDL